LIESPTLPFGEEKLVIFGVNGVKVTTPMSVVPPLLTVGGAMAETV